MRNLTYKILMIREAAAVQRVHTLPHHGSYTNGSHQYGCVMLYLQLHPDPQMRTVRAILAHDLGERWVGDNPAPAKWSMPKQLRDAMEELEFRCLRSIGEMWELDEEEARWLKAVDCVDLWLWGHEQMAMGNRNAGIVVKNLDRFFELKPDIFPDEIKAFIADYEWTRTEDEIPE